MRKVISEKKIMKCLAVALAGAMLCGVTGCGSSGSYPAKSSDAAYAVAPSRTQGFSSNATSDAASDAGSYDSDYAEEDYYADSASAENADTDAGSGNADTSRYAQSNKKIIKRYNYSYETEHFDDAYAYLKQQIEKYNGYIASSDVNGKEQRRLYLEARIPADQSDAFVSQLGDLGTVVSQSQSSEDVTLQYADTEGRISSLKTEQERLIALLEKADTLETIIALENRLTEVRYELESYESQKKVYDDLVTYSTISINLSEVSYTVEVDDTNVITRIVTGLERSLRDVGNGLINFLVGIIIALPYLVVWAIGLYLAFIIGRGIIRLIIKRHQKKKAKKLEKKQRKEEKALAKQKEKQENEQEKQQKKDKAEENKEDTIV